MTIYLATAAGWCFFVAIFPYGFLGDDSSVQAYLQTTFVRALDMWRFAPRTLANLLIVSGCGLAISYVLVRTQSENSWTALLRRLYVLIFVFGISMLIASVLIRGLHSMILAGVLLVMAVFTARKQSREMAIE